MSSTLAMVIAIVAVPVISAWLWPFGRCRSCGGSGKSLGSNRRRWGNCRRCKGSGKRQRFGARLFRQH